MMLCFDRINQLILFWVDQEIYIAQNARKAFYFAMQYLKKGNRNAKRFAYTSFLRPVIEYAAACWDP
jgi:hypothetical protein